MSIRCACEADLPQVLAIYTPYITDTAYSLEYTVPGLDEFTARFRRITAQFPWLVWEEEGRILGYAYGSLPFERVGYRWSGEASIYLHPDARRKGIGRVLYTALEELMKLQGYRNIYAIITAANETSVAFHQALGYHKMAHFTRCAYKFGRWMDVIWMEKQLQVVDSPKVFPLPIADIVKTNRNICDILDNLSLS